MKIKTQVEFQNVHLLSVWVNICILAVVYGIQTSTIDVCLLTEIDSNVLIYDQTVQSLRIHFAPWNRINIPFT